MQALPTVSVIVPNFMHAAYLEARLASIASQSYQDFEVIMLDAAILFAVMASAATLSAVMAPVNIFADVIALAAS